jgi:2-polyprenyl-6-hydroxyphenyl methylase/3-demethylubiquinone-9 3-methyltransferase
MADYYEEKLSSLRLKQCYDIAPPRVQRYLQAEIDCVLEKVHSEYRILEMGCGYGRVLSRLAPKAMQAIGIDTSHSSLLLGKETFPEVTNFHFFRMNAVQTGFFDRSFHLVVCIQNGISAFRVDQKELIRESIRITRPGGTVLFSSYSERFWEYRHDWFRIQADAGLLGEIDEEKTGGGVIVCKDGFTATTVDADEFRILTQDFNVNVKIKEVDESSLFCEITIPDK